MGFLASKTVIYVTHQMESLYSADHILVGISTLKNFIVFVVSQTKMYVLVLDPPVVFIIF